MLRKLIDGNLVIIYLESSVMKGVLTFLTTENKTYDHLCGNLKTNGVSYTTNVLPLIDILFSSPVILCNCSFNSVDISSCFARTNRIFSLGRLQAAINFIYTGKTICVSQYCCVFNVLKDSFKLTLVLHINLFCLK